MQKQTNFGILVLLNIGVSWSLIEGDIRWPTILLSNDALLTLTVQGDATVFRKPSLQLLRNDEIIYNEKFTISDTPTRKDISFACNLFTLQGIYEVRVIGTPGAPPVYSSDKLINQYPSFSFSFPNAQIKDPSKDVNVFGLFDPNLICKKSDVSIKVVVEKNENKKKWKQVFSTNAPFPTSSLTIPNSVFCAAGKYRLTTLLESTILSRSLSVVISRDQYRLDVKLKRTDPYRLELAQCEKSDDMFDVKYSSPLCFEGHKINLVPIHNSNYLNLKTKTFHLSSRAHTIRVPCSEIHPSANGACIYYLDNYSQIKVTKCFAMIARPTPDVSGSWSQWEDQISCTAPCFLINHIDDVIISEHQVLKSKWSFQTRKCSNPSALGFGKSCASNRSTLFNNYEYDVFHTEGNNCWDPWQLAHSIPAETMCECGCSKTMDLNSAVIFSPAPWRCNAPEIIWNFHCSDCDAVLLNVLHLDIDKSEDLFIHENNKVYRINELGTNQRYTKNVLIRYKTGTKTRCGFALRLIFNRALFIPTEKTSPDDTIAGETNESPKAKLSVWGIAVCFGFLALLLIAAFLNRQSSRPESKKYDTVTKQLPTHDQNIVAENNANLPGNPELNSARYLLAQHQFRRMKQDGNLSAVANYPRHLCETKKDIEEQIPLLFGNPAKESSESNSDLKHTPVSSNSTKMTHSTTLSD